MEPRKPTIGQQYGLTRRQLMTMGIVGLTAWTVEPLSYAFAGTGDDLEQITRIAGLPSRKGPLLVFRDYTTDPDVEIEQHIRRQLFGRKDLLSRIKKKVGFKKQLRLNIEEIQVRLQFIPQSQDGLGTAYQRYCLDITDSIFGMNGMDNIYSAITSPEKSYPAISQDGISAFLVHRLAKDFRATCRFTAESGNSIKTIISGAIYSNHLGAVDLEIEMVAPGQFELARKPFTIWQNDTDNLYTLMAIPAEETLHYLLGRATDREISTHFQNRPPESLAAARNIAEEWMALEESVVGGLVDRVLRRYCENRRLKWSDLFANNPQAMVPELRQYRYRKRGLQLVADLGFQHAMDLYLDSPSRFRERLL
ncbi:hypothetical protein DSCW_45300 [Desulfosarcina widdelii]|uniref:Uncharacterized protein n=1 Tax=Desulfosarcina widdelii TaxID=947919 RepID=A0A5K7ZBG6_9BACT|nr:hypothetical protein [Desulfosarcina widdelii]BBO77113.1 hypothetical protein DSCW_45300 [Desulfosarcina widdelii]